MFASWDSQMTRVGDYTHSLIHTSVYAFLFYKKNILTLCFACLLRDTYIWHGFVITHTHLLSHTFMYAFVLQKTYHHSQILISCVCLVTHTYDTGSWLHTHVLSHSSVCAFVLQKKYLHTKITLLIHIDWYLFCSSCDTSCCARWCDIILFLLSHAMAHDITIVPSLIYGDCFAANHE